MATATRTSSSPPQPPPVQTPKTMKKKKGGEKFRSRQKQTSGKETWFIATPCLFLKPPCGIMWPLKRTLAHSQFLFQSHTERISQRERERDAAEAATWRSWTWRRPHQSSDCDTERERHTLYRKTHKFSLILCSVCELKWRKSWACTSLKLVG